MSSDLLSPSSSTAAQPVTLVLLPGMDGTGVLFEPFVAALGEAFSVVSVSYPPSGGSQTYAELQHVAARALSAEGRVVLLGESFSGPIAISLAAANPGRVAGVVLCCTFVRNPRPGLKWLSGLASVPAPLPPLPLVSAMLFGRLATPSLRKLMREALARVRPAVLRARLRAVISVDVRVQAQALKVPVLYLRATRDRLIPPAASTEAAQHCRGMKILSFDAPHCLLQTVPAEAARVVSAFVESVAAP